VDKSIVTYYDDVDQHEESWKVNGELHNDDGPANTQIIYKEELKIVSWYAHGKLHRKNKPAVKVYKLDNKLDNELIKEEWHHHGMRHRIDGPAYMLYRNNGENFRSMWFMRGEYIEPFDHWPLNHEQQIEMKLKYG